MQIGKGLGVSKKIRLNNRKTMGANLDGHRHIYPENHAKSSWINEVHTIGWGMFALPGQTEPDKIGDPCCRHVNRTIRSINAGIWSEKQKF